MEIQPRNRLSSGPRMVHGRRVIDAIVQGQGPSRLAVSAVRFTPGARTAWRSHSLGQALYVTEGEGLVESLGEPTVTIRSGDVVHTPPDE